MHNELEMLHRALSDGTISKAELQDRLTAVIEEAYQRLPVDAAFIAECESLLQTVITGDAAASPSIAADCWKTLHTHTQVRKSVTLGWKSRLAVVAATFVLMIGLRELCFDRTWLGGKSTYGGSTYIIGNHQQNGGILTAVANEWKDDGEWQELNTQSWEELTVFLGYEPPSVDVTALGLNPNGFYYGSISNASRYSDQSFDALLSDGTFRWLNIGIIDFADTDSVLFAFNQLHPGKNVMLSNGTEVYVSTPIGGAWLADKRGVSVTWLDGTRVYHLTGGLSEQEMLAAAEALCSQEH